MNNIFKQRLGALVSHATVLTVLYFLNIPNQLLFGYTLLFFSPIWIKFLKFFVAIAKNNPKIVIPYIVTYIIAIAYYFYTYGISISTISYLVLGSLLLLTIMFLYNYTYDYLENEGLEYRWKALLSYTTATTFGVILSIFIKVLLS